jgi:hypothetical protein
VQPVETFIFGEYVVQCGRDDPPEGTHLFSHRLR